MARARRIKNAKRDAARRVNEKKAYTDAQVQIANTVAASEDVVRDVMRQEVTPIVREALTEDVMGSIRQLVSLTPKMIAAIEDDLANPDDNVRQRAYTLLAKYTLGNPSVAPAPTTPATASPMQVFFEMPRPGAQHQDDPIHDGDAVELKQCSECQAEKPTTEFVANSERCQDCHDRLQAKVQERFGA